MSRRRFMGMRRIGRPPTLSIALFATVAFAVGSCGGSNPGKNQQFTSYSGCIPPCILDVLDACLGYPTSCHPCSAGVGVSCTACTVTPGSFGTCWNTAAGQTVVANANTDGGGRIQDTTIYAPDGSICATIRGSIGTGTNAPLVAFYDASGNLFGSANPDPNAPYGDAWQCGGNKYASKGILGACTCHESLLTGDCGTAAVGACE